MLHTVIFLALFEAAVHCVPQPQPFIVGGRETTIDRFPFMVSLQTNGYDHFCGGSILDENTILTAAHCVVALSPLNVYRLYIRAGSSNWFEGGEKYNVTGIHIHESFNDEIGDRDNDIALLTLGRPLIFSRDVQPILLPHKKFKPIAVDSVIVAGWGTRSYNNDDFPEILNYLDVRIVDQNVCKNAYSDWEPYVVTERQLCAGWMDIGNKDACQADSGGPLFLITQMGPIQVGIVSWGKECGLPNYPGVYTRVRAYLEWIAKTSATIHHH